MLRNALRRNFEVLTAQHLAEAKALLSVMVKVALVDVRLSEEDVTNRDGMVLLRWAKERYPDTPMFMMSAYRNFDVEVEALNMGAGYLLKKPIALRQLKEILHEFGENGLRPERTAALRWQMGREIE